jgi:hypothetical protein
MRDQVRSLINDIDASPKGISTIFGEVPEATVFPHGIGIVRPGAYNLSGAGVW